MKCDQSNGYQQLVINSEPGSVDSAIDNLSIRQLSIANGNKLGRDAIASHWIARGATRFIVILFSYIGNFLRGQLPKSDRVERRADTYKLKNLRFFNLYVRDL
jgi:hypothetical protein